MPRSEEASGGGLTSPVGLLAANVLDGLAARGVAVERSFEALPA